MNGRIFRDVLHVDSLVLGPCRTEDWELAAGRWNTYIKQYNVNPNNPASDRCLRRFTGDIVKKEYQLATHASERAAEHSFLHLVASPTAPPYKTVTATTDQCKD